MYISGVNINDNYMEEKRGELPQHQMTIRESFAVQILAGLSAKNSGEQASSNVYNAVTQADALLKQLKEIKGYH